MKVTEQEIMALEGAELDAAIATEVMGWKKSAYPNNVCWDLTGPAVHRWHPSTNISQAYEAEGMVPREQWGKHLDAFYSVICRENRLQLDHFRDQLHPTATQRCHALLLWKLRNER